MKSVKVNSWVNLTTCIISFFILVFNTGSHAQNWVWAKSHGGNSSETGLKICNDLNGNTFVAGTFTSTTMNFGPLTINSLGSSDVYVVKYDPSGSPIWVNRIAGTGLDQLGDICTDASGNVYVIGSYYSSSLSLQSFTVNNSGLYSDIYVASISAAGAPLWLKSYGTSSEDTGFDLAFSNSESALYITGVFFGNSTISFGSVNVVNTYNYPQIFLTKMSISGLVVTPLWGNSIGGNPTNEKPAALALDNTNSVYIAGHCNSGAVFGTTTLYVYNMYYGGFLAKWSSTGAFQWATGFGDADTSPTTNNTYCTDLAIDGSNNCYVSGYFNSASFSVTSTGTSIPNSGLAPTNDGFCVKYSASGVLQSISTIGGSGDDKINGIAVDNNSNLYLTGQYSGTVLTLGASSFTNTTPGTSTDIFVAKKNSAGSYAWGTVANGIGSEVANDVSTDSQGNAFITGRYNISGATSFGTTTLTSVGADDGFVAKISCLSTTISGLSNVCSGSSATLTASGATTYTWSNGSNASSIVITPTANTTYTLLGAIGSCTGTGTAFSVTVLPANLSVGPNFSLSCGQSQTVNAIATPSAPVSVVWTPSIGLSNSGILNPVISPTSPSTQYTVSVNLINGCLVTGTLQVSRVVPTPDICQVTVDSLGVNNEIYWEKTLYPTADSFFVYRETSLNTYKKIAALSKSSLSMYIDTNRTIGPANGNPNLTYYKYKLQLRDTCGNYSPLSKWHETIFIQDQMNGNFNWNSYAIESSVPPITLYNLKRRDIGTGAETIVVSTAGNLASDPFYNTFWPTNTKWFVDAIGFNCTPTLLSNPKNGNQIQVLKTKTKSNQSNDKTFSTLVETNSSLLDDVEIYPNPASGVLNVNLNILNKSEVVVEIRNVLGQTVFANRSLNQHLSIDISTLENGVYFINIKQEERTANRKIIVSR